MRIFVGSGRNYNMEKWDFPSQFCRVKERLLWLFTFLKYCLR